MTTATISRHVRRWVASQSLGDLTDRQLLEAFAREEDEAAFALLVRRHGAMVLNACRGVVPHMQDAEDAFQATFLVLARKAAAGGWHESVGSWLFATARNMALKIRTHSARRHRHEVAMDDLAQASDGARRAWGDLEALVEEELNGLPEKYRAALVLCHMEGKSRAEAARELGWKEGAVKVRLERGRDLLRQRLTRRGLALSAGLVGSVLGGTAQAALPPRLVESTVQAALCFAAGRTIATGLVSAQATALAHGGLGTMAIKCKLAVLTLGVLLAAASTGLLAEQPAAAPADKAVAPAAAAADQAENPMAGAADIYGDPLPKGAKMRFGTLRLRHGAPVYFVGFAAQGKELITGSHDGTLRVWELPAGKELRRLGKGLAKHVRPGPNDVGMANVLPVLSAAATPGASVIALSPAGDTLAIAAPNGDIQFYETATGKEGSKIATAKGNIATLVFTPDGKAVATRGPDGIIRQWDIATAKEVRSYGTANNAAAGQVIIVVNGVVRGSGGSALAFTPDGKKLAAYKSHYDQKTGKVSGETQIWSTETGKEIKSIKDSEVNGFSSAATLTVSPDSKVLAWAAADGAVHLFDIETGKELRKVGSGGSVQTLAFAPDGKTLAVHNADHVVRVFDPENGKELAAFGDKAVEPRNNNVVVRSFAYGNAAPSIAFAADSQTLAVAGNNNTVRIWNVATGKEVLPVAQGHHGGVSALTVSADGKTMTSRGADHIIRQWDMATGKETRQFKLPAGAGNAVFSPDGTRVAFVALDDNTARVWDVVKGAETQSIKMPAPAANPFVIGNNAAAVRLAFSPDGKLLASRGSELKTYLWDAATGAEVRVLDEPQPKQDNPNANGVIMIRNVGQGAAGVAFAGDGATVAVVSGTPNVGMVRIAGQPAQPGGARSYARFWNTTSGKQVRHFTIDKPVATFDFSPDDRNLATLNSDGTVSIWEVASGKERQQFKAAGSIIQFAPDGYTVAVAGDPDRKATLYDIRTGKELASFDGHQGSILTLAFSPDNGTLLTGSADSTVLSWDLAGLSKAARPTAAALDANQVQALWTDLAGGDPKKAYQAVVSLSLDGQPSTTFLAERVKPASGVDAKRIDLLIADLEDNNFQVRQRAADELEKLGDLAEVALEKVLKGQPNLETRKRVEALMEKMFTGKEPPADVVQALRGVEALEAIGSSEAKQALEKVAQGATGAKVTRSAQAAVQRLNQRSGK